MALSREERLSKKVRELQRLPENKTCAECGERGPGYVCCDFNTFVCTGCSGLLREFNFRIKGVSMSTFTIDEVSTRSLKAGGNARARAVWLYSYKAGHDSKFRREPDSSYHRSQIREWIKAKYQEKKWLNENAKGDTITTPSSEGKKVEITTRKKRDEKKNLKEIMPNVPKIVVTEKNQQNDTDSDQPSLLDFNGSFTQNVESSEHEVEQELFGDFTSASTPELATVKTSLSPQTADIFDPFATLTLETGDDSIASDRTHAEVKRGNTSAILHEGLSIANTSKGTTNSALESLSLGLGANDSSKLSSEERNVVVGKVGHSAKLKNEFNAITQTNSIAENPFLTFAQDSLASSTKNARKGDDDPFNFF